MRMLSEFVMQDRQKQYDAPYRLHRAGYSATSGDTCKGPTITVEHHQTQLSDVQEIVYTLDPAARPY
jgi:hypothetical protein